PRDRSPNSGGPRPAGRRAAAPGPRRMAGSGMAGARVGLLGWVRMAMFLPHCLPGKPPCRQGRRDGFSLPSLGTNRQNASGLVVPTVRGNAMVEYKFPGKVVLVTGSSRGMGAAILEAFARAGATCLVN